MKGGQYAVEISEEENNLDTGIATPFHNTRKWRGGAYFPPSEMSSP